MDLNKDGSKDVVLPITKGYEQERTLELHIAFTSDGNTLKFDLAANDKMPAQAAPLKRSSITLNSSTGEFFLTVNIDTREVADRKAYSVGPAKFPSELILVTQTDSKITAESIFPKRLKLFRGSHRLLMPHAFAVGDITGDGLDDLWVGTGGSEGGFQLTQKQDGTFGFSRDAFQQLIGVDWPNDDGSQGSNSIQSQLLTDVNNDGYDDLIVGGVAAEILVPQHPPMFLLITMVLIAMIRASQFHLPFMAPRINKALKY